MNGKTMQALYRAAIVLAGGLLVTSPLRAATGLVGVVATYDRVVPGCVLAQRPIYVTDRTGLYRVTGVATVTIPATAGTVSFNIFWYDGELGSLRTDGTGSTNATWAGVGPEESFVFYASQGGPISVNTVATGVTGSPSCNVHFVIEQF